MAAARIIDGKAISADIRRRLADEVGDLTARGARPGLAVVLVGENPASQVYVRNKARACEELGLYSEQHTLPQQTTQQELIGLVKQLNGKPEIHGILVQMPLPGHLDEKAVIDAISPDKDVDAFHERNVGAIMLGDYRFLPCTPAGVMELLKAENVDVRGKECVVVGRSNIVGKPMAMLLLHEDATVTICHSRTRNLPEVCRRADVLVSAVGRAGFITADMVKPGAVVIDVGMNRNAEGRLCGDVDFQAVSQVAGAITPVPGGVGPMTITMLMQNTIASARAGQK